MKVTRHFLFLKNLACANVYLFVLHVRFCYFRDVTLLQNFLQLQKNTNTVREIKLYNILVTAKTDWGTVHNQLRNKLNVSVISSNSCTVQYLNNIQVTRQLVLYFMTSHLPWRRGICEEMGGWWRHTYLDDEEYVRRWVGDAEYGRAAESGYVLVWNVCS